VDGVSNIRYRETVKEIAERLLNSSGVIVSSHIEPDGDSIGCMVAMWRALRAKGINSYLIWEGEIPNRLKFVIENCEITKEEPRDYDTAIVLDSGDLNRLQPAFRNMLKNCRVVINIDHHKSNSMFGDINLVDVESSSAAEMALDLIEELGVELSFDIALPLYVGLITDTGNFSYANTNRKSHLTAIRLISVGVDPYIIHKVLNENKDIKFILLLGDALKSIKLKMGGKIAVIRITSKMLDDNKFDPREVNGFIEYARAVKGIDVAVLLREEDNKVKVSMRSKGKVDVNKIAMALGGGGHEKAAGCEVEGDIDSVERTILNHLEELMGSYK